MVSSLDSRDVENALAPHSCGHGAENVAFMRMDGIRRWADAQGLSLRDALCALLAQGIWPERFRRNFGVVPADVMIRLLRSRMLIVGCGGLGGHVAALLARLGVGSLRLCDPDVFEESNLNRQYFCTEKTLGQNKAQTVRQGVLDIASYMDVEALPVAASPSTLPALLRDTQAVLDCLDSLPAKKMLEKAALAARVPFIHGSVLREEGFAFLAASGVARLASLYPVELDEAELEAGNKEGVSAMAPAGVACLMASLTVSAIRKEHRDSGLFHLDYSVPELERFQW